MDPRDVIDDDSGGTKPLYVARPNTISFGSQMLAVGAGFCVFIVLLALFAAVQHRKRRRSSMGSSFRSPLIHKTSQRPSQAIPPPPAPPQYLRCSNQQLRKCSSPGGSSDYSLSSYSSSADSAHSLSPMSPYATHLPSYQQSNGGGPFAGVNFIPYGMDQNGHHNPPNSGKRHSSSASVGPTAATLMGGVPELVLGPDGFGRGSVSLHLAYDPANLALQVTVMACTGLPTFAGNAMSLNPYIKLRLLPDGQHRVKTRILRDTRDPIFDEAFTMYGLSADTLRQCTLHLAALAFDRYNGDTVLGETTFDLAELHEATSVTLKWQAREPFRGQKGGKALVALQFEPKQRTVKFALRQIDELPHDSSLGLPDPYAKVYALINGQKRVAKHKTRMQRLTQSPVFGPEDWLEFALPESVGRDPQSGVPNSLSFHVVVFNHDGVKRNEPIGQFTVDAESEAFAAAFQEGVAQNEEATEWHTILPF